MTFAARNIGQTVAGTPTSVFNGFSVTKITSGGTLNAIVTFNTDGSIAGSGSGTGGNPTSQYFDPVTVGIGTSYWVRATATSGSFSGGTTDTWLALSSNRAWNRTTAAFGVQTVVATFDISSDSGGSVIVATGSITLTADGT